MPNALHLLALRKAARILGSEERLCELIDAPPGPFRRWMQGTEALPLPVFLMLVDFLSDMETPSDTLFPPAGPRSTQPR